MRGPVTERCEVLRTGRVGAYHELLLAAPGIAALSRPGQFVQVLAGEDRPFVLRRPFSVHRAAPAAPPARPGGLGTIELVLDVVGPGTQALAGLAVHQALDVVGPLGQPFRLPRDPARCVLVGGGYGAAALFGLAEELTGRGCVVDFLLGAATADRLCKSLEARRVARAVVLTTADGSAGRPGLVTDALPELLRAGRASVLYACGPMSMLAATTGLAAAAGVPCQVAVEERMACGTGVCFSCVVPVHDSAGGTRMARACLEGPVFDGTAVDWAPYRAARSGPAGPAPVRGAAPGGRAKEPIP